MFLLGVDDLRVSCTSARACVAVGTYAADTDDDLVAFSVRWNGVRWKSLTGNPGAGRSSFGSLTDVSCPRRTDCVAVGYIQPSVELGTGELTTLAQRWNGGEWLTQNTPDQATPAPAQLSEVSCAKPSACIAVGRYTDSSGVLHALAERWNGTGWTLQNVPTPSSCMFSPQCQLNAVSCPTSVSCVAVGTGVFGPLVAIWSSGVWRIQSIPVPVGDAASLTGVSCTSPTACVAVGGSSGTDTGAPLVERFDGSAWAIQAVRNPPGGTGELSAISCSAPDTCTAAGSFTKTQPGAFVTQPLVERWDGSTWTIQSTPTLSFATLDATSCASPSACTVVGWLSPTNASGSQPLAEGWDGGEWKVESIPNPAAGFNTLSGVSCISAVACTSVGSFGSTAGVEAWDGSRWTIQSTPATGTPGGLSGLSGISCPAPGLCVAVGFAGNGHGGNSPLAEVYN